MHMSNAERAVTVRRASSEFLRAAANMKLAEIRGGAEALAVLELEAGADPGAVRSAYRRLAKIYHPDAHADLVAASPDLAEVLDAIISALSVAKRLLLEPAAVRAPLGVPPPPARPGRPLRPGRGRDRERSASDWYADGLKLLAGHDPAGAAQRFGRAAELAPEDAEFRRALGEALSNVPGRRWLAIGPLEHAVRLDPDSTGAWFLLGEVRESTGDLRGAREAFATASALSPSDMRARLAVGRVTAALDGAGERART